MSQVLQNKLKESIRVSVAIADRASGAAAGELRKVLDVLIRDVYQRKIRDPRSEPLQNLIGPLVREGLLPQTVADCADIVKKIGNIGVHSAQKTVSEAEFVSALQNLLPVLRWYECEYQEVGGEPAGDFEPRERGRDSEGPYKNATVILATRGFSSDVENEWVKIRNSLFADGVTVVSADGARIDNSEVQNTLFVQLFSTLDQLDQAELQFEKCNSKFDSKHILQWRKTLPNPRIDSEILRGFDEDERRFCEGARTGSFEEFTMAVRDRVAELMIPIQQGAGRLKPYLYITADRSNKRDDDYAGKFQDVACKYVDADVMMKGKEGEQKTDFKDALKGASGVIFLYGDTQPEFIEKWLAFYKREKQLIYMRMRTSSKPNPQLNLKLTVLYEAPPEEEGKKKLKPRKGIAEDELPTYGSREAFSLDDVAEICMKLRR